MLMVCFFSVFFARFFTIYHNNNFASLAGCLYFSMTRKFDYHFVWDILYVLCECSTQMQQNVVFLAILKDCYCFYQEHLEKRQGKKEVTVVKMN